MRPQHGTPRGATSSQRPQLCGTGPCPTSNAPGRHKPLEDTVGRSYDRLPAPRDAWKCLSGSGMRCSPSSPEASPAPLEAAINHSPTWLLRPALEGQGSPPSWPGPLWPLQVTLGFQASPLALQDRGLRRRRQERDGTAIQQGRAARGHPEGTKGRGLPPVQGQARRQGGRRGALL